MLCRPQIGDGEMAKICEAFDDRGQSPIEPAVLLTEQAAIYLQIARSTLETMRVRGGGPKFCKLGGRVRYRKVDLDAWIEASVRASTSEAA